MAEELGLPALAEMEAQAVRTRPVPPRLLTAILRPHDGFLTRREREVMVLLTSGLTRKEIAEELGVGEETVKHHLKRTYRKLGVSRQVQAINAFLEWEA